MKYIDADKLIKLVNNYRDGAKAALNPIDVDADYYKGKIDACENIQELIASLQQEQPEVDLEKEIDEYYHENLGFIISPIDTRIIVEHIANHFYELGQRTKYQQDREEFAKLKAKEWQDGYDEGYEQAEKDTIERAISVLVNLPSLVISSNYIAYFREKMLEE